MKRREEVFNSFEERQMGVHCVSRTMDRVFKFGSKEKAVFVKMMRQYEKFCGVEILSYCVMSNHFHVLVRVPADNGEELSDEVFAERLIALYGEREAESDPARK